MQTAAEARSEAGPRSGDDRLERENSGAQSDLPKRRRSRETRVCYSSALRLLSKKNGTDSVAGRGKDRPAITRGNRPPRPGDGAGHDFVSYLSVGSHLVQHRECARTPPSIECGMPNVKADCYLMATVAPASSSSVLSFSASSFGDAFLDLGRGSFDHFLRFLETQAGRGADHLDDVDLLVAKALEDDVKLGLLFDQRPQLPAVRSAAPATATAPPAAALMPWTSSR